MAPQLQGKWIKIDQKGTDVGPGARSSHGIAAVGDKMYSFGGEFKPICPIDSEIYVFDLKTHEWSIAPATGDIPKPLIGASVGAIGSTIYVFGGRGPDTNRSDHLYAYDTLTNEWKLLSSGVEGLPARCYHSATTDDQNVYIFGGCTDHTRLKTLLAYNVVDRKWVEYPTPAGEACRGRGGAGLAAVEGKIWVIYGFCGAEMDDIHRFDPIKGEWTQIETTGEKPSARSMFATAVIGKHIFIFGGETEPSELMHRGAGILDSDIYGLDTETLVWKKWEVGAEEEEQLPEPRGWCGFATAKKDGKEGLLVYGGNSLSNERHDDIFFFTPFTSYVNGN